MASILKVDKLDPQSGTALEIGSSGDTITIPSGATFTQSGTMNASAITAGTIATARLGSGTASSSTVLYGDQTYKTEPGGGKILQVVQATTTSASTHSSGSYTASNVFGSITPTAASSKIFVTVLWLGTVSNTGQTYVGGAAKLYQDIEGGGYAALFPTAIGNVSFRNTGASGDHSLRANQSITYLDSPSYTLTDVITYKLYALGGYLSWGNYYVCPDGDSASVIMMEVAA
tara:strand:- start:477 stop:1169 length:693 start_codon:yes stop_codon:yes gene_type:complete